DSGLIVSRGSAVRFWHLTFQEYLAARAIAGQPDKTQHDLLIKKDRMYVPEWREVTLLLAGILIRQGRAKVDSLIARALDRLEKDVSLPNQAKCLGLLGGIVQDLHTVGYQPSDSRYHDLLRTVLGIFETQRAATISFEERWDAATALG